MVEKKKKKKKPTTRRTHHRPFHWPKTRYLFKDVLIDQNAESAVTTVVFDSGKRDEQAAWKLLDAASRITGLALHLPKDSDDCAVLKHCVFSVQIDGESQMEAPIWYGNHQTEEISGWDLNIEIPLGSSFKVCIWGWNPKRPISAHVVAELRKL